MTLVYADSTALQAWTGQTPPANATQLLRSASLLVTAATVTAYYTVDPATLLPTDTATAQAFSDATCAQVAAWVAASIDPTTDGLGVATTAPVRSRTLDGANVSYDTSLVASPQVLAARQRLATQLCDEAVRILQDAQLLTTAAWIIG